jgi:NADH dehydrogenase
MAAALKLIQARPALTSSAIAGIINDADLDPSEAMHDLGYRPLGVREGFSRCFPLEVERSRATQGQPLSSFGRV